MEVDGTALGDYERKACEMILKIGSIKFWIKRNIRGIMFSSITLYNASEFTLIFRYRKSGKIIIPMTNPTILYAFTLGREWKLSLAELFSLF